MALEALLDKSSLGEGEVWDRIYQKPPLRLYDSSGISSVLYKLYQQGFLSLDSENITSFASFNRTYSIKHEGAEEYQAEVKRREELIKKEKLELQQLESVIATNESVVKTNQSVSDTNRIQRRILRVTVFLSALTLIISIFTLFKKESVNVAPSPVILQPAQPSKDSMIRLIWSTIGLKDSLHNNP